MPRGVPGKGLHAATRYPLAVLLTAAGHTHTAEIHVIRLLRVSGTAWKKAQEHGLLENTADTWSTRLGLHPYNVWPEMRANHAERYGEAEEEAA